MAVRATVLPQPEPGHAILRLTELEASPDGLTLSIQRQQGPDSHLADDGWRRTETWLQPARVERSAGREKGALDFHLGPEICDRLAGIATVRLRVKEPDIGVVGTTVVAWPTMLTSGAIDKDRRALDDVVRLRQPQPEVAPPPPVPPFEPPKPAPELRARREPPPEPKSRSGATGWLIAAMVLVALAGGGYWFYSNYFVKKWPETLAAQPTPPPHADAPKKTVRDAVAEYLATKPTPEAMLAKGKELAAAGDLGAAFLVWRRAAEVGNVPAQLEVAAFFDPLSPPKGGFTPDGPRAADWYERAALAGLPEAQRKYGLLLAKGGAGLTADPAKAKSWLQQAAAQNDADARKALEGLPK